MKEEPRDGFGEVVAGEVEVGGARIVQRGLDALSDDEARLVHQVFVVAQVDEAARDDVRGFVELARAAVDGRDDDTEAFLAERFSVAHEDVGDLRDGLAFDDAQFRRRFDRELDDLLAVDDLDDRSVVGNDDVLRVHAHLVGEVGMDAQHVVVAVDGDEEFRFDLCVDPLGLLAVAVAGCVHVAGVVGDDVCALTRKIVFQLSARRARCPE